LYQILHTSIPRYLPLLSTSPELPYSSLLDVSARILGSFDTAVSSMYPPQDEMEIEKAMNDLDEQSRALASALRSRLKVVGDEGKLEACLKFLDRWEATMQKEKESWRARRLSLTSLGEALVP
jgi:hypothetical protein